MVELNKIYNEDCFKTLNNMEDNFIDVILTSPPYNTGRAITTQRALSTHNGRYDVYLDDKTPTQYVDWIVDLFNIFDAKLKENGVVLWNCSYGSDETVNGDYNDTLYLLLADIIKRTNFTIVDTITWKKHCALPNNVSKNRLTRICEPVYVFCRKTERTTFNCNKRISSIGTNGQTFYAPLENFFVAKNNDGSCPYNKATFSTEFVDKLLKMYAPTDSVVYNPFMGSGTTAVGCVMNNINYIGSEISEQQCKFSMSRINGTVANDTSEFTVCDLF